jgi:predicted metal-binding membrane protein
MFDDERERARDRSPMLVISAIAWGVILLDPGGIFGSTHGGAAHVTHVAHSAHTAQAAPGMPVAAIAAGWIVMLVAMMTPALIPAVRHVRLRSFTHRRPRAIAIFAAAYAAIWIAAGAVLIALAFACNLLALYSYLPIAGVLLAAFAWQCSPAKQVCLNRCHRHIELPAFGREADLGVLRFGVTHGLWCAGACWALMLAALVLPQAHLGAMAGATVLIVSERFDRPRPPSWRVRGGGTLLHAAITRARTRLSPRRYGLA